MVRYGRLAGAAVAGRAEDPRVVAAALVAASEAVVAGHGPTPAASAEETECVLRWLEQPGTRLVGLTGTWSCPAHGAGGVTALGRCRGDRARPARPVRRPARHPTGAPAGRRRQPHRLTADRRQRQGCEQGPTR